MSYASYLLQIYGVNEDRILHREPGFYKGIHDQMKDAPSPKVKTFAIKALHDREGKEAALKDKQASDKVKAHAKRVDKAIGAATKKVIVASKQKKEQEFLAGLGLSSKSKVSARKPTSSGGSRTRTTSDVPPTEVMAAGGRTKGAQAVLDILGRGTTASNWRAGTDKTLTNADGDAYGVTASFRKNGKILTGVERQVFPAEYKGNPRFAGGKFAGDKDDSGKELKAGDQYVAEALDIIIGMIDEGYSDKDAFDVACQYLYGEGGYGRWSAKHVLNEALAVGI